jgi:arylsulfatase A-like enzyme
MEGIFIAAGKTIEPGPKQKIRIVDLFPTIVALLGLPIPEGLDGQTPSGLFVVPPAAARCTVQTKPGGRGVPAGRGEGPGEAWEKEIRERLQGLGYI